MFPIYFPSLLTLRWPRLLCWRWTATRTAASPKRNWSVMFFYIKNLNYILHLKQRYSSIIFTDMKKLAFSWKLDVFILRLRLFSDRKPSQPCWSTRFVFLCFSNLYFCVSLKWPENSRSCREPWVSRSTFWKTDLSTKNAVFVCFIFS